MVGRTQFNEEVISKMTKKQLEKVYKGRKDRLEKALVIWDKHNPKKVVKEEE
jgi:hypothetical protein